MHKVLNDLYFSIFTEAVRTGTIVIIPVQYLSLQTLDVSYIAYRKGHNESSLGSQIKYKNRVFLLLQDPFKRTPNLTSSACGIINCGGIYSLVIEYYIFFLTVSQIIKLSR